MRSNDQSHARPMPTDIGAKRMHTCEDALTAKRPLTARMEFAMYLFELAILKPACKSGSFEYSRAQAFLESNADRLLREQMRCE